MSTIPSNSVPEPNSPLAVPGPAAMDACETMQQMAKTGCCTLDFRRKLFKASEEVRRILEAASKQDALTFSFVVNTIHPDDRSRAAQFFYRTEALTQRERLECRLLMPDGRLKFVAGAFDINYDEHGKPLEASGVLQDITALKALQQENTQLQQLLMQQSKMAQMGAMIDGIAHQWKQPLHQINSILPQLERHHANGTLTPEFLEQSLDRIELLTEHLSQTVDSFRHFFHPQKPEERFDIAAAVSETLALMAGELARSGVVTTFSCENSHTAFGSKKEFVQAFFSIINNARECFLHRDVTQPKLSVEVACDGTEITVTIRDNAGGIPAQYVNKIFDLYFTTKRQGHGTGLGLYIAKMLIEKGMYGTITAENEGDGAAFVIHLPGDGAAE
jgi:C4-dicarboxylate-specific signal transduction histidine kinase